MSNEKDYIDQSHGMELGIDVDPNNRNNENGIVFLVENYMFKHMLGELTKEDIAQFQLIVENLEAYDKDGKRIKGLYDRGAGESLWEDKEKIRTISLDNLHAISAFSYLVDKEYDMDLGYHKHIRAYMKKYHGRFDNVYPESPRWKRMMLPWHLTIWAYFGGSWLSLLFMWFPMLEMIVSCHKKNDVRPTFIQKVVEYFKTKKWSKIKRVTAATSGKKLALMRLYPMRKNLIGKMVWRICSYFVAKNYPEGWKYVYEFYFKDQNHPILEKMRRVYKKNPRLF